MSPRGKKRTPPKLDHLFKRNVIPEDQYRDFWPKYWDAKTERERKAVIAEFTGAALSTRSRKEAEADAQRLADSLGAKFTVKRRNAKGRFSKRGRNYQAVRSSKLMEE